VPLSKAEVLAFCSRLEYLMYIELTFENDVRFGKRTCLAKVMSVDEGGATVFAQVNAPPRKPLSMRLENHSLKSICFPRPARTWLLSPEPGKHGPLHHHSVLVPPDAVLRKKPKTLRLTINGRPLAEWERGKGRKMNDYDSDGKVVGKYERINVHNTILPSERHEGTVIAMNGVPVAYYDERFHSFIEITPETYLGFEEYDAN
jgi:hypothetical protein